MSTDALIPADKQSEAAGIELIGRENAGNRRIRGYPADNINIYCYHGTEELLDMSAEERTQP